MVYLSDLHRLYATLLENLIQISHLQPKTVIKKHKKVQKSLHKPLRLGKSD